MSLLLDARKKLQQAHSAQEGVHTPKASELSLEEHPEPAATSESGTQPIENARSAGQNLFAAKSPSLPGGRTLPNRNLLYALGGTVLLLTLGAGYFWYIDSAGNTIPLRPINAPPAPPAHQMQPAATKPAIQNTPLAEAGTSSAAGNPEKTQQAAAVPAQSTPAAMPAPRDSAPLRPTSDSIRIEQQKIEPVDPLPGDAYLAYRSGRLDEARQMYLAMLKKDEHNPDALLGLAAIAQERGENQEAAQYLGRVLVLDPRNAVANAGMSALNTDDDYNESRLKTLLREQGNSAALHFALGNLYAGQSRWGEAQQAYFNAYTLESGNAEYAFNLAVSLDHLGQKKLAAQHYQRAMQLDPSHSAGFDHAQISQRVQELAR